MHRIKKIAIGRFRAYRLFNPEGEYVEVLSDFGAGINDLRIAQPEAGLSSFLQGYRTEEEIVNTHHQKYFGSKLSPICNRVEGGRYSFQGKDYQLAINEPDRNTHLHGLAHHRPFEVVSSKADGSEALLALRFQYLGTELGFPFPYTLEIRFSLRDRQLAVNSCLTNGGSVSMPISDGWHPYFTFTSLEDVNLLMSPARRVNSLVGNAIGEGHGFDRASAINGRKFDDCFEVDTSLEECEIQMIDNKTQTLIKLRQSCGEGQYRYFQVFTPESRESIAVEPVTAPPNAFNSGDGLIVLEPGESKNMELIIEFGSLQ